MAGQVPVGSQPVVTKPVPLTPEQQAAQDASDAVIWNQGTTYQTTGKHIRENNGNPYGGVDNRDFTYGRTATGADDAVARTTQIGNVAGDYGAGSINAGNIANQTGVNLLNQRTGDAAYFNGRQTGNPQAMGLAGLETQQGPSGAQAQLQQGSNLALASQLALARSGHGFGGNAAAAGLAAGNVAGIQANQANQAAGLAAQEYAAWRGRQASNLANSAGIQLNSQGQNDAAALQTLGLGQQGYFQGAGLQQQGYGQGLQGTSIGLQGQQVNNTTRGLELQGGQTKEDDALRYWAAKSGLDAGAQARQDQQTAALIQGAATVGGTIVGAVAGGPAGAAVGGAAGSAVGGAAGAAATKK